jgi:hypothetical protein
LPAAAVEKEKEKEGATDYETASYEIKTAIGLLLRKTRICKLFKEGKCDYGHACRFAHIAGQDAFQILCGFEYIFSIAW